MPCPSSGTVLWYNGHYYNYHWGTFQVVPSETGTTADVYYPGGHDVAQCISNTPVYQDNTGKYWVWPFTANGYQFSAWFTDSDIVTGGGGNSGTSSGSSSSSSGSTNNNNNSAST